MSEQDHGQCHDLVCNADRRYPRGARGVGCSCRGRDAAYIEREHVRASLVAEVRREIREKCERSGYAFEHDLLALPSLATKETD